MSSNKDDKIERDDEDQQGGQQDVSDLDASDVDVRGGRKAGGSAAPPPGD